MPTITGTATFERVEVEAFPQKDVFEVTGFYDGSTTTYQTPALEVGGLPVENTDSCTMTLDRPSSDEWVWVVAEESRIVVSAENPEEGE